MGAFREDTLGGKHSGKLTAFCMQVKASPHKSFSRRHLDIDRGSSERLVAAAENKLHAYDRKIHLGTYHSKVDLLKQDLGAKIAQYFEATSRMRGSN